MRFSRKTGTLLAIFLAAASLAAKPPARTERKMNEPETSSKPAAPAVTRWLVLGPVLDPLPAFHEEKPGSYGVEELLKSDRFHARPWRPAEGTEEPWFGGAKLRWTARDAGPDGLVSLAAPEGAGEGRPATAWLAAYVAAGRYVSLDLVVKGTHARRAWLDGEQVAIGGTDKEAAPPAEVKGKLELTTGKHVLVIEAAFDPAKADAWTAGASLEARKKSDEASAAFAATLDPAWDLDIRDVLDPPQIVALAVSPEGTEVAVSLSRIVPATDDAERWVEFRSTADGALLGTWRGGPAAKQVAYDPQGRWLSYVTEAKGGSGDADRSTLWILDRRTQEARPLLERVESLADYEWSPDGRAIVYSTAVKPEADKRGVKRFEGLLDRQKDYRTKTYLHLATVPQGTRRRLTAGSLSATGAAFSPGGDRLLFIREVEDFGARPYTRKELWEIDLGTFAARKLRDGRWFESAQYAPDGKTGPDPGGPLRVRLRGNQRPRGDDPQRGRRPALHLGPRDQPGRGDHAGLRSGRDLGRVEPRGRQHLRESRGPRPRARLPVRRRGEDLRAGRNGMRGRERGGLRGAGPRGRGERDLALDAVRVSPSPTSRAERRRCCWSRRRPRWPACGREASNRGASPLRAGARSTGGSTSRPASSPRAPRSIR